MPSLNDRPPASDPVTRFLDVLSLHGAGAVRGAILDALEAARDARSDRPDRFPSIGIRR